VPTRAPATGDFVLDLRLAAAQSPPQPVRVLTPRELVLAVRHAADEGLAVELGTQAVESALVLDLSGMKRIVVDPRARTVRVQAGATVAEVESAAAAHGLAPRVERGRIASADLVAAQVVARDGSIVHAIADTTPELLELVRTGALLGVVVEATYRLR
jgi:hypothetical protein